jgi:hypothetical protein
MSDWTARSFILNRNDGLQLRVSAGDFSTDPAWRWFVCKRESFYWITIAQGTVDTIEEAKAKAGEWADKYVAVP